MRSHSVKRAESRRLVLIVGDGLRADLLFNEDAFPTIPDAPKVVAPYLKSIAATRGAFGISHTRVDFDSVFNRSSHTFSFGSPDILHMFSQGATPRRVKTWTYHKKYEDFTKDWSATFLDLWVLDRLKELFRNATTDATLDAQLRSDKVVFFLHLLGLDTTGHMYRPHTREYMNNIRLVDSIVQQTETLINDFYNDQETSFVFTADHGMSAIGNHGDGEPHNTRTPLIAWGQGIRGPLPDSNPSSHDSYSKAWGLGHLFRRDIEQADLAALMASLLGIHWPVNSIGVLPDVDPTRPGYVSPKLGDESLAQTALVNARAILEQYTTKHELKKARTLFYKPFKALKGFNTTDNKTHTITSLTEIEHLIQTKNWNASRSASAELIKTGLGGLHYLQTYDRLLICGIVTVAYIGWAAYASLYVFCPSDFVGPQEVPGAVFVHATAALTLVGFWTLFALQHAPSTFYVLVGLRIPQNLSFYKVLVGVGMAVAILQFMVAAYTHRFIWSIGFALIGVVWPITWPIEKLKQFRHTVTAWAVLCLVAAIFPVLSVEKQESLSAILSGGCLVLVCGGLVALWVLGNVERQKGGASRHILTSLFMIQAVLIIATMLVTSSSVRSLKAKQGLPPVNQILGWIILGTLSSALLGKYQRVITQVVSSLLPFVSGAKHHTVFSKFLVYFLGFGPCFVILSNSVEGLFYVIYSSVLVTWVVVESIARNGVKPMATESKRHKVYQFRPDDLRIALFFLFFIQVGFFGAGK
ncbi:hypothetical protein DXG01_004037 [Tephrocybe rancida]|nr:hypothetical protein DXG01_004037 [Tephrocybe rancida]